MAGRFSRKPRTADEWRSRAEAIQARLHGLSIAELMRGPIDSPQPGGTVGPDDHHYNPNQPRVPAGHPDGGRWTSGGRSAFSGSAAGDAGQINRRRIGQFASPSDLRAEAQNIGIVLPDPPWPPGVFPEGAPPELVLNALNPEAMVFSNSGAPDVAGAMTGTVTTLPNGFEVTNGRFGIIARNLATGRIDAAVFSVPRGVTATVTKLPNGDIKIAFSTGL